MKPKVSVLLSTFNGEKYIKDLVNSILEQKEVDILLQVRDDGSTDDTIRILQEYNDTRISIQTGENLKPAKSFLKLLKDCKPSEYYAYCDQDDVWYPEKLKIATDCLKGIKEPALFISTYDIVDKNLNRMFTYNMKFEEPYRLQDTIIYRAPSACTMVFNEALRKIINKTFPEHVRMHDFWTLLVAELYDLKIFTCDKPLIQYRQHGDNSVGITPTLGKRIKRLYMSLIKGDNERWRQAVSLYNGYKDDIDEEKRKILEAIVFYRRSYADRIRLILDKQFLTSSPYINFLFKLSVLLGKF